MGSFGCGGRGFEENVTKMQKLLARHKLPIYPNFVVCRLLAGSWKPVFFRSNANGCCLGLEETSGEGVVSSNGLRFEIHYFKQRNNPCKNLRF
jgi:hypothetical protein